MFLSVTFKTLPTLSFSDTMLCKNARTCNIDFGAAEDASPLLAEATDQSLLRVMLMAKLQGGKTCVHIGNVNMSLGLNKYQRFPSEAASRLNLL